MDAELKIEPTERIRKFWTAHGRSVEVATVLVALRNNRTEAWTPEQLCVWYGVPLDRAETTV